MAVQNDAMTTLRSSSHPRGSTLLHVILKPLCESRLKPYPCHNRHHTPSPPHNCHRSGESVIFVVVICRLLNFLSAQDLKVAVVEELDFVVAMAWPELSQGLVKYGYFF